MKIITYLVFTVLSIAIQFVVMDLISEKIIANDAKDLNVTSTKKHLRDVLHQYANKPHALYFRHPDSLHGRSVSKSYTNLSLQEITPETSTTTSDISSTIFDLLYDDNNNNTTTEDTYTQSTDLLYTSTESELGNVTDITLFGKNNATEMGKPKVTPKITVSKNCNCNLMYKVCDINCCCDNDCTEMERKIFVCTTSALNTEPKHHSYYSPFPYISYSIGANIDALFCVAKSNLPDKRNIIHNKHDPSMLNKFFKWHTSSKQTNVEEFTKSYYKYADPIWLLRNGSIYYVDIPVTVTNGYCNGRKPIRFLKQQNIKCYVKLSDLEILQILSTVQETSVISVIENTLNTSSLNCSTLHCTNWAIHLCNEDACTNYNKSLHDPLCTENICTHLALKVDYTFYYYESKIMNASITLHTQKVQLNMPFINQEINVRFVIANKSEEQIVKFSGSPGYITGLPVIAAYVKENYTESFFNGTSKSKKYLYFPDNENGACVESNKSNNYVLFGTNKRIKCRYYHLQNVNNKNGSEVCSKIQKNIIGLLGIEEKVAVSPLGNPNGISDKNWIVMKIDTTDVLLYGQFNTLKTRLNCYNLLTRFALIFTFADTSDGISNSKTTILSGSIGGTPTNTTFNMEAMSTVVTIDTSFIDETKPSVYEYAGGPQLDIYLPRDFFFPFPSNEVSSPTCSKFLITLVCFTLLIKK